jgi:methylmalonyl-CoA mutase cobalamin-binding subunit
VATGIDVVLNLKAHGLARPGGIRGAIERAAERGRARVHETTTIDDLEEVARGIAARGTHGVVLAGGDGSYMAGLTALARAHAGRGLPPIAFAPGGTVCTVARNLGMTGGARAYAARIVEAACNGGTRAVAQSTLRVRDDGGGDRVGFIFGAGLVLRFFEAYYAAPRQGLVAAARLVARVFAGSLSGSAFAKHVLHPARCSLQVDRGGETRTTGARDELEDNHEWSLVLASVIRDVGLHVLVPYRAGEETDRFHLVASGLPPRALGMQLPRALRGLPLTGEPRVDVLARSVRVAFENDDGGYVLDGDVFRARAVKVEPGPVFTLLRL